MAKVFIPSPFQENPASADAEAKSAQSPDQAFNKCELRKPLARLVRPLSHRPAYPSIFLASSLLAFLERDAEAYVASDSRRGKRL